MCEKILWITKYIIAKPNKISNINTNHIEHHEKSIKSQRILYWVY